MTQMTFYLYPIPPCLCALHCAQRRPDLPSAAQLLQPAPGVEALSVLRGATFVGEVLEVLGSGRKRKKAVVSGLGDGTSAQAPVVKMDPYLKNTSGPQTQENKGVHKYVCIYEIPEILAIQPGRERKWHLAKLKLLGLGSRLGRINLHLPSDEPPSTQHGASTRRMQGTAHG